MSALRRKGFARLLCFALALLLSPSLVAAEEAILSFHSRIVVQADGVLDVTEIIRVRAEGRQIRRGILRDFPTEYGGLLGTTGINVLDVRLDGGAVNWTTERLSNGVRIRIGSADRFLPSGDYSYVIHYTTPRQLRFFDDADELYWNVTGTGWDFPIYEASATVVLPEGVEARRATAYTGRQGESGSDFAIERLADRTEFTTTRRLSRREGLTIVIDWPPGHVYRASAAEQVAGSLLVDRSLVVALVALLVLSAYYILVWLKVGQDPDGGPIIARYKAPSGLSPAASGFILDMKFSQRAFTAAIISLAVKGYLFIDGEVDDEPTLVRTDASPRLSPGEAAVARRLFPSNVAGARFRIEQDNHEDIAKAIKALKKTLIAEHEAAHFARNRLHFYSGLVLAVAGIGGAAAFAREPEAALFISVWMSVWCFGAYAAFNRISARIPMLASGRGLIKGIGSVVAFIPLLIGMGIGGSLLLSQVSVPTVVIILAILGVALLFEQLLKAPTRLGRRVMDEIEGFKLYLSVAEKDRMEFHNPPERTPELFEKYLPYAIALGVEHQWGEKFEDVLAAAAADPDSGYHPRWHRGYHHGRFSSSAFASSLGGSLTSTIASAGTAPSSGGSGFGGGGFSGGGGGGGGGGGW